MQNYTSSGLDRGNAWLIAFVLLMLFVNVATRVFSGASDMAPTVTSGNIRRITLGMNRIEVERILGRPRYVTKTADQAFGTINDIISLHFANRVRYALWCPMLCVNMEQDRVVSVYAQRKEGWGGDHHVVYCLTADTERDIDYLEDTFPP